MGASDDRDELVVLTRGWSDDIRASFLDSYERFRRAGLPHEAAMMLALGELLP